MVDNQLQKAEELAARPYVTIVSRESDGDDYYYVATHPDLTGCTAVGYTPEEAKQELAKARIDFIYFLLEDNLTVPDPKSYEITPNFDYAKEYTSFSDEGQKIPNIGYLVEDLTPA